MAELEIKKHLKKIISIIKLPAEGWVKKAGAITTEIAVIVFSLVLANMLHNHSLKKHQEEECRIFLQGLKEDLNADISGLKESILFYQKADTAYTYLHSLTPASSLTQKNANDCIALIGMSYSFRSHSSRYEGFKSSGKLLQIEDQSLLYNILLLYQEKIQDLNTSESAWLASHNKLINYLIEETDLDFNNVDVDLFRKTFNQHKVKNYTARLIPWSQLTGRYKSVLQLEMEIIRQIEKSYPNDKG